MVRPPLHFRIIVYHESYLLVNRLRCHRKLNSILMSKPISSINSCAKLTTSIYIDDDNHQQQAMCWNKKHSHTTIQCYLLLLNFSMPGYPVAKYIQQIEAAIPQSLSLLSFCFAVKQFIKQWKIIDRWKCGRAYATIKLFLL